MAKPVTEKPSKENPFENERYLVTGVTLRSRDKLRRRITTLGRALGVRCVIIDHTYEKTLEHLKSVCRAHQKCDAMPRIILMGDEAYWKTTEVYDKKGFHAGYCSGLQSMWTEGICVSVIHVQDPVTSPSGLNPLHVRALAWNKTIPADLKLKR